MSSTIEERNRRMRRARDAMDRGFARPLDVGFASLGTFSRTFREIVGESPLQCRARFADGGATLRIPACWAMTWLRPAG